MLFDVSSKLLLPLFASPWTTTNSSLRLLRTRPRGCSGSNSPRARVASSLCSAAKAIATEVVLGLMRGGAPSPAPVKAHALIIDGRDSEHMHDLCAHQLSGCATSGEGPARLRRDSEAALPLGSGGRGGAARAACAHRDESMETDQLEPNLGRPAASANPAFGTGARDAAG